MGSEAGNSGRSLVTQGVILGTIPGRLTNQPYNLLYIPAAVDHCRSYQEKMAHICMLLARHHLV